MFTLSATPIEFCSLLALFTLSVVSEAANLRRANSSTGRVSSALHLFMAVMMLLMVPKSWWKPVESAFPIGAQIAVMALATCWFIMIALRAPAGHRSHSLTCAAMFATMVWHLSVMKIHMDHMAMAMNHSTMSGAMSGTSMAQHQMGSAMPMAPTWMQTASQPGHQLWWLAVLGTVLVCVMLGVTIRDITAVIRTHTDVLARLGEAAMCLGMAWMSTGLLTPFMPWITAVTI